uniref:IPT/TIG domain-containing protein n=2 Tax=Ostreococcus mediterraneus TaxID=1486918 RepID=A0A7S0KFV9_9CHLO
MAASASIPIWVAAVPSTNSGVPSYGTTLAVGEDYYGVLERYESTTMPTTYRWIADPAPTMSITLKCVSQGVGETATSTNNVCVHSNQLATGFVAVMMSYDGAALPRSGAYDSAAAMKVVATPTTSSMTPARGPAEGGALTWMSGSNLHESIRAGDGWVPRCSFGVDTSGSSMGTFVSSALIACETPYIGTTTSSAQVIVAGSSLSAIASGPKYSFMANTLVTQHSIVPHLGPIYGGTRVVFTLSTDVSATSMTSCRFGTVVVNGWSPLVYTDITADAGIMCVAPALAVGTYSIGVGTVRGSIGDSTTSPFTLGGLAYQVYSEY